ncbi:MAG: putative metal-binding motif-containing protein [Alphaproteobacteria bacterium]|nr:putative metal-binding motif-containing protein [Alphaproteobacteria bacterium]
MLILSLALAAPLDPRDHPPLAVGWSPAGPVSIDTSANPPTIDDGQVVLEGLVVANSAVFAFDGLVWDQPTTVTGQRALALLSWSELALTAPLDLSAVGPDAGPGGYRAQMDGDGVGPGGGDGGTHGAGGGFGGRGGDAGTANGGAVYGNLRVVVEGGSGGGSPTGSLEGGGGGGALELGAIGVLTVASDVRVDGANGDSGDDDGGGGGAGGGVLLHGAPGSACTARIDARGGDGGDSGERYGGGGGGGGRVVALGLAMAGCDVDTGGGRHGNGEDGSGQDGATGATTVDADPDLDADGSPASSDCDDLDAAVHPGMPEMQCDGIDQNCDGQDRCDPVDRDGDGHEAAVDCDDLDPDVHPGADEVECDGTDQDCDGEDPCPTEPPPDADPDLDGDGVPNPDERVLGTDPENPDSDGDALDDGLEVYVYGTDPLRADTDGGGMNDGLEVELGGDPTDPGDDAALLAQARGCACGTGRSAAAGWMALLAIAVRRRRG